MTDRRIPTAPSNPFLLSLLKGKNSLHLNIATVNHIVTLAMNGGKSGPVKVQFRTYNAGECDFVFDVEEGDAPPTDTNAWRGKDDE